MAYRANALKITFKREAGLHTQDTRDYVEAGCKDYRQGLQVRTMGYFDNIDGVSANLESPAEATLTTPETNRRGRLFRAAYLSIFVAGTILFPEHTAGLTLGFLLLDAGLWYPFS